MEHRLNRQLPFVVATAVSDDWIAPAHLIFVSEISMTIPGCMASLGPLGRRQQRSVPNQDPTSTAK